MDEHEDYKNNWIENAIYLAVEHMHANTSEANIIDILRAELIPEDNLSFILVSAKMLHHDEVNEFTGDE